MFPIVGQTSGRVVLDSVVHKLPSSRKSYHLALIVPESGLPVIEYYQKGGVSAKKPKKLIQFVDLLFADKKHDTNEKFAFSIYTTDKTTTFLAQDETTMNEWLAKIREHHSNLYPEFKRYEAIFEANLLNEGLAKTMEIQGPYRLALCKDSFDLIPLLSSKQQQSTVTTAHTTNHHHHLHAPQHQPHHQRFDKRHPLLKQKTIELVFSSIRRCGHTDCNFYVEPGRHSQIGGGGLWMALAKKSTARQLHELLLATMKLASTTEGDQFPSKAPRSRSGSTATTAMSASTTTTTTTTTTNTNIAIPMLSNNNNNIDEDSGYLPMA